MIEENRVYCGCWAQILLIIFQHDTLAKLVREHGYQVYAKIQNDLPTFAGFKVLAACLQSAPALAPPDKDSVFKKLDACLQL